MSEHPRPDSAAKAAVVTTYLVALVVASVVVWWGRDWHPLWRVGVADVAATLVVFAFSQRHANHSMYDAYWSVAPMVIAPYLAFSVGGSEAVGLRHGIVLGLVMAWGARLTFNWWRQWKGLAHEDWRYVDLRAQHGQRFWLVSLAGIHLLPTMLVYAGCLSLYVSLGVGSRPFGVLDVLGAAVTAIGIWFEATADRQLHEFVRRGPRPGEILDTGLWARCRHPNYFGEITFWWGLSILGLAADPTQWWIVAGPLAITLLFVFISLPMIEKRHAKRRIGWAEHAARIPLLLPRGRRGPRRTNVRRT